MRSVLALLAVAAATSAAAQSPCPPMAPLSTGGLSEGTLLARLRQEGACPSTNPSRFSLKHTRVEGEISGFLAGMTVTQVFENPYQVPLEAIYVFPLPELAAVDAMEIVIGQRVIRGVIKTREQARQVYEQARAEGKAAALLDQERPNIFTQSVANILPGEEIRVRIHYVERLKYEAGGYELNFPMTVGPRFIGGAPLPYRQGEGTSPDTTTVQDASRITPPVLPPERRSGRDIQISLRIDAGLPVQAIRSTSHDVVTTRGAGNVVNVSLSPGDTIPNRTFTLQYSTADALIRPAVLVHRERGADHGYFMVLLQPQLSPSDAEIVPREIYMVLDTSCSQSGAPIEKSKAVAAEVLRHLHPEDTFQVLNFDTSVTKFAPEAVPNTRVNVERALPYVQAFWGGGGTDINIAVREALTPPGDPRRMRMMLLMTDGFIGNDDEVLRTLKDRRREEQRIFAVGVGNDVNRYLVHKMGEQGRGGSTYVNLRRPAEEVAREFEERIRGPVLTSIAVDTQGLPVFQVYPQQVPDLFQGQPLFLIGKYEGSGRGILRIAGKVRGRERRFEVPLDLPEAEPANAALKSLWARQRIDELTIQGYRGETPEVVQGITQTALAYSLMSKYTSFVAVEEVVRLEPGTGAVKEMVPVELPEGVSFGGVFGELSREEIPPGDPVIAVKAPSDARRVTAYFPFGLVKPLTWDAVTASWRGRFLVPVEVADGEYQVAIAAELADGAVRRREVRYRLDSKGPDFEVKLSKRTLRPGEALRIDVDAIEATREVSVYCEAFGEDQLLLESKDGIRFGRELRLPANAKAGEYELVLIARDAAGNRFERREQIRVEAAGGAGGASR